ACARRAEGTMILESPLTAVKVVLCDWRALALLHALAQPGEVNDLPRRVPELDQAAADQLVGLLVHAGMVEAEEPAALQTWQFHDLLFHARSREGRHDAPLGATYRFAGLMQPPAATQLSPEGIPLARPDLDRLRHTDLPFEEVVRRRRSVRE